MTTIMLLYLTPVVRSSNFGNLIIKSIIIFCHGTSSTGIGCNSSCGLCREFLFFAYEAYSVSTSLTTVFSCRMRYPLGILLIIFVIPRCPLSGDLCIACINSLDSSGGTGVFFLCRPCFRSL